MVSRRGRGGLARLESPPPINRYAGDWSVCGRDLLSGQEADYDEVAGSESDGGKQMNRTVYQTKVAATACDSEKKYFSLLYSGNCFFILLV